MNDDRLHMTTVTTTTGQPHHGQEEDCTGRNAARPQREENRQADQIGELLDINFLVNIPGVQFNVITGQS